MADDRVVSAQPPTKSQLTSARIILIAQSLSVVAAVAGLIGIAISYRTLTRGQNSTTSTELKTFE